MECGPIRLFNVHHHQSLPHTPQPPLYYNVQQSIQVCMTNTGRLIYNQGITTKLIKVPPGARELVTHDSPNLDLCEVLIYLQIYQWLCWSWRKSAGGPEHLPFNWQLVRTVEAPHHGGILESWDCHGLLLHLTCFTCHHHQDYPHWSWLSYSTNQQT
ncbi:hypothetical protein INR49_025058, partial [Caranx melampygus]